MTSSEGRFSVGVVADDGNPVRLRTVAELDTHIAANP